MALVVIVLFGCAWVIARMRHARKEMQQREAENLKQTTLQEASLYRIFQELIANIIKHAQGTEVNVQVYTAGKTLIMMVENNRVGMSTTESSPHEGIGLSNIRYRVQLLHDT